jgi:hypothetical protein
VAIASLCTEAAEARVEARADVAGARGRLCTRLSLRASSRLAISLTRFTLFSTRIENMRRIASNEQIDMRFHVFQETKCITCETKY